MDLVLIGLSHKTAPVEIRERVAFPEETLERALKCLTGELGLGEGMIVSTCNRVEIIAHGNHNPSQILEVLKHFFHRYHDLAPPFLDDYLYDYSHSEAVRHVFRVTSSLDSMVVGETQILGQIKQAYALARQAGSVGSHLNDLLPRAFFVAKKVRTQTRIGASAVSVSSVAVELARKIFGDLHAKTVLLLGAGEMSELAARSLMDSGINRTLIANRTASRAERMADQFSGRAVPLDSLEESLVESDIVLVSTGSDSYVLTRPLMERVIRSRKNQPVFVIDISVPRNVDPAVNDLENVFLYDIDDLQSVISANIKQRQREAEIAEDMVHEEVQNYVKRLSTRSVGPLIEQVLKRIDELCLQELENHQSKLDPEELERLEKILRKTSHKVAHPLISELRQAEENPGQQLYKIKMFRKMFRLDEE